MMPELHLNGNANQPVKRENEINTCSTAIRFTNVPTVEGAVALWYNPVSSRCQKLSEVGVRAPSYGSVTFRVEVLIS